LLKKIKSSLLSMTYCIFRSFTFVWFLFNVNLFRRIFHFFSYRFQFSLNSFSLLSFFTLLAGILSPLLSSVCRSNKFIESTKQFFMFLCFYSISRGDSLVIVIFLYINIEFFYIGFSKQEFILFRNN